MARLVFGIPYRQVAKQLKERGCNKVRRTQGGREVWVTPRGFMFPITASRKEISSADAMRMNQTLRKEDIQEIRPNPQRRKKSAVDKETARQKREEAREKKELLLPPTPKLLPPPKTTPAPVIYRPRHLFEAFKRRYFAAKEGHNAKEEDSNDSSRSAVA